jgi:hypothetical protein
MKGDEMDRYLKQRSNAFGLLIGVLMVTSIILQTLATGSAAAFSPEKAGFTLKFNDEVSPYRVISVFVLPGETVTLEARDTNKKNKYALRPPAGKTKQIATNKWHWQAPQKTGLYPVKIMPPRSTDSITLNVFVMVPYSRLKGEDLNGYLIGQYSTPLNQSSTYKPPRGFIEVTKQNEGTYISPHFKLKQFLCKQKSGYPKYVVLKERLLLKLELILEKVNEMGYQYDTFNIMSGYRTPYYNKALCNVTYSCHVYGSAADIFIDGNPKDGMMDDLNYDGNIDYRDAAVLANIIDEMDGKPSYSRFVGGLGLYEKTNFHGPFVHVDVRGSRARWGVNQYASRVSDDLVAMHYTKEP